MLVHTWRILVLQFQTTFSTWWKFPSFVLLDDWRILVFQVKTTHTSTPWIFASFVLLHNWGILVLQFKTTHTSTQWNFSSFVRYFTIEGFWFFNSKQLILLQLNEIFLPLCATSQLKDFGSSIQNNLYFFNSMKKFFLCVLLHNWRILVLRFKTTYTSSTPWKNSSFVRYFTIEGFWFFDSKQLILLQIEFHSYLKHQKHWSHCVSKRKKKKKTTHTLCWSTICMPFH